VLIEQRTFNQRSNLMKSILQTSLQTINNFIDWNNDILCSLSMLILVMFPTMSTFRLTGHENRRRNQDTEKAYRVSTSRTNNFPRKSTKHSTRKPAFCYDFIVIIVLLRILSSLFCFLINSFEKYCLIQAEIDKKLYNLRRVYIIREEENLRRKFV